MISENRLKFLQMAYIVKGGHILLELKALSTLTRNYYGIFWREKFQKHLTNSS